MAAIGTEGVNVPSHAIQVGHANEDLSGADALFVKLASADMRVGIAGATDIPDGVFLHSLPDATFGDDVGIKYAGMPGCRVRLKCNGASVNIARGDWIKPVANGRGEKATGAGTVVAARALEALTADGQIILVKLVGPFLLHA